MKPTRPMVPARMMQTMMRKMASSERAPDSFVLSEHDEPSQFVLQKQRLFFASVSYPHTPFDEHTEEPVTHSAPNNGRRRRRRSRRRRKGEEGWRRITVDQNRPTNQPTNRPTPVLPRPGCARRTARAAPDGLEEDVVLAVVVLDDVLRVEDVRRVRRALERERELARHLAPVLAPARVREGHAEGRVHRVCADGAAVRDEFAAPSFARAGRALDDSILHANSPQPTQLALFSLGRGCGRDGATRARRRPCPHRPRVARTRRARSPSSQPPSRAGRTRIARGLGAPRWGRESCTHRRV